MTYTIHLDSSTRLYYFAIRKSWQQQPTAAAAFGCKETSNDNLST